MEVWREENEEEELNKEGKIGKERETEMPEELRKGNKGVEGREKGG